MGIAQGVRVVRGGPGRLVTPATSICPKRKLMLFFHSGGKAREGTNYSLHPNPMQSKILPASHSLLPTRLTTERAGGPSRASESF